MWCPTQMTDPSDGGFRSAKSRRSDAKVTALLAEITIVTRKIFHPFAGLDPLVFRVSFSVSCVPRHVIVM